MKTNRYWLRVGIFFILLYAILVIVTMPKNLAINFDEFIFGLAILQYPITAIEVFMGAEFNSPLSLILGGVVTWFALGAFFGFMYGKIKNLRRGTIMK